MKSLATTKMSSKGQVVIPEEIRNQLGLSTGVQFVVVGQGDVVILKAISTMPTKEFQPLIKEARSKARKAGLKKSDINNAIRKVRTNK